MLPYWDLQHAAGEGSTLTPVSSYLWKRGTDSSYTSPACPILMEHRLLQSPQGVTVSVLLSCAHCPEPFM